MKSKLLLTLLLAFICWSVNAQNSWSPKSKFITARYGAAGFSICDKGYIGTGLDSSGNRNDFWEWDSQTNTWTQKADFGGTARASAVGFSIGDSGYIGTGDLCNGLCPQNDLWLYDPTSNTWTQKANFAGGMREQAVGFSIGRKGYIGTGEINNGNNKYNDFYEYDPSNDSWSMKSNFPGVARTGAVGFSIGAKGYIGTGTGNGTGLTDFWEWDQASDTWTQKQDFPGVGRFYAVGFSIGNYGYLGAGSGYEGAGLQDFYAYNSINDTWTQETNYSDIALYAVAFSICYKGYVGTGATTIGDGGNSLFKDFNEYTPSNPPVANFTPSQISFCDSTCINFIDNSTNAPATWIWTFSGGTPDTSTIQNPTNICFNTAGTYSVSLTVSPNGNCCPLTVTKIVTVHPNPAIPSISQNGFTLASSVSGTTYQWYRNGVLQSQYTTQYPTITPAENGFWYVVVTNSFGCSSTSPTVPTTVGIHELINNISVSIYPNPANNQLMVHASSTHNEDVTISVMNVVGEIVQQEELRWSGDISLNINNLSAGMYFLQMKTESGSVVNKFIKE